MCNIFFIFALFFCAGAASAQTKYWIFLKDKDTTGYDCTRHLSASTLENRQLLGLPLYQYSDVPLNDVYLKELAERKAELVVRSKWLNAVSAYMSADDAVTISGLDFVERVVPIDSRLRIAGLSDAQKQLYSEALRQMKADDFSKAGLTGKGVKVGVIDGGFYGANQNEQLEHIFKGNRVAATRDFVNPKKTDPFGDIETWDDIHGSMVLEVIAGRDEQTGSQNGAAPAATFYLARTDHGELEFRGEEDHWVAAMEWLDSLGVRLINTSLGYATRFTDSTENYKPEQMNGTSVISKAAQMAVDKKGMFIVVSAGNEGDDPNWQIISTPADTKGVLSVGATDSYGFKIGYSGIGPKFLPYLKPDVACFSLNGTSFSAPAVTGFAACLLEKYPQLKSQELGDIIRMSSNLYPYSNNYIGYGVPSAEKALKLAADRKAAVNNTELKRVKGNEVKITEGVSGSEPIKVFHKYDATQVLMQTAAMPVNNTLTVKKPKDCKRTTVDLGSKVVEVIWE